MALSIAPVAEKKEASVHVGLRVQRRSRSKVGQVQIAAEFSEVDAKPYFAMRRRRVYCARKGPGDSPDLETERSSRDEIASVIRKLPNPNAFFLLLLNIGAQPRSGQQAEIWRNCRDSPGSNWI